MSSEIERNFHNQAADGSGKADIGASMGSAGSYAIAADGSGKADIGASIGGASQDTLAAGSPVKPRLIVVAGPTASGKTGAAIEIAKIIGGEVVSADSVQVYSGLDIGSAKVTEEEAKGIPHHMIDVMNFDQRMSVALYKEMAKKVLDGIYERGHIPVICGGTGFYIQAIIYDIDFEDEPGEDNGYRRELQELLNKEGSDALSLLLKKTDPLSYGKIDIKNPRRVIRALEYYHSHNESISIHNERERLRRENPPYDILFFVLYGDRDKMYERIEKRVDLMMNAGLVDEVMRLKRDGMTKDSPAAMSIGYSEILKYLDGELSLDEAVTLIKKNTRHYAKRQLTWFKREKNAFWINADRGSALDEIRKYL